MEEIDQTILQEKIKTARLSMGLSQESLAEISNISLRTIQRIEKGSVVPRLFTLKTLAKVLGLTLSDFSSKKLKKRDGNMEMGLLKRMNLSILLTLIIPLSNIIFPFALWKIYQKSGVKQRQGGKIISFQILWTLLCIILFFLSIALNNLISGDAGNGIYIAMIVYVLCLAFNLVMVSKSTWQLNQGDKDTLAFVPNFF